MRVVFLGRLAAFPSTLMAAAAGSSGVSWRAFVIADTAGALVSLGWLLGLGLRCWARPTRKPGRG